MTRRIALVVTVVATLSTGAWADEARGVSLDPNLRSSGSFFDASPQRRPSMFSVFLNFPAAYWGWGGVPVGLGGRFYLPLLHDGFVPSINDSLGLEAGADLIAIGRSSLLLGVGIPVEVMWALHLFPKFALYLKAGIALELHFGNWCWNNSGVCNDTTLFGYGVIFALGGWVHLTDSVWLRFEAGYPGLKLGLGFPL